MILTVVEIDHLVINVADVEASATWYQRVLGMVREDSDAKGEETSRTSLKFGKHKINLRPVSASQQTWFTAVNVASGSSDLCFLTKVGPDQVITHLTECGVTVEKGPIQKRGALGTLMSVYCRDPDGSLIEISSYEIDS